MANINDFKLVKLKSEKMFNFLNVINCDGLSDTEKGRLGFYHLVLENITGLRDVEDIKEIIIDTDYNKMIHSKTMNDLGMDAVYIQNDTMESTIQLFNFKYREKFNVNKTKEEGSLTSSIKFLEYIGCDNEDIKSLPKNKVKECLVDINTLLDSNCICNIILYMVSNEANGFSSGTDPYIKLLEKNYGMKVVNISLDDIIGYFVSRRGDKESKFVLGENDFLSFEKDELATQKSYITKMSLVDLIRITCDNNELTGNYNVEDDMIISDVKLDYSLLYDNVRGFLGETNYNINIQNTLRDNSKEFFMLNNGITFTATGISVDKVNSGMRYLFTLNNFQIVNGGQTIRSIYNYLEKDATELSIEKLRGTFILVRIFKISENDELKNRIAEYTNSQNSIASSDLKSVDQIQIQIERYFKEEKILYARKAGDLGDEEIDYQYRISKEKLAQILYSSFGYPDRASNQKKRLFQEYYNDIFKSNKFTIEKAVEYCKIYFEIENLYKNSLSGWKYFDQKAFYVLYIVITYKYKISEAINVLEKTLKEDKNGTTEARVLLKAKFKEKLDNKINNGFMIDIFDFIT